uniref:protein-glutamine gamma-glutamyltransferase n=1 Tax=Anopheles atroparvus TaxID=41427 RepID=A0AAG5DTV4_ANOAO
MPPKVNRIWPTRKVAPNSTIKNVLEVSAVDMCIAENGRAFHTDRYEMMGNPRPSKLPTQLVVRRGAPFTVKLQCNRSYDPAVDTMVLILAVDAFGSEKINFGNGTEVCILVQPQGSSGRGETVPDEWSATLSETGKEANGKVTHTVTIFTHAKASVGKYNMKIHCRLDTMDTKSSFEKAPPLYLLFNAWCERDDVYMKDEKARQEYVLNDTTMLWRQMPTKEGMVSWNVGQYEKDVLDCALWVIAVTGRVSPTYRGNPVRVVRALTGALNINNGPGVLEGRWNGDYADGVSPLAWSGSVKILQQFFNEGMQAVKYGQCFVYSGLFTTVCRAVGIPIRIVTNFSSAHDTEASLTVDYFVDPSGNTADDMSSDSIWNYHVWNEVWMARPDLTDGKYDGWQVVDATPQELSDGMFKLGPAPVVAVKNGEVNVAFDTEFVFAEVNADKMYWAIRGENGVPKLLQTNTADIGKDISTKAIGVNDREDLTSAYKHPEGTPEERQVMAAALKLGSQRYSSCGVAKRLLVPQASSYTGEGSAEWVKLQLNARGNHVLGQPFGIELIVSSTREGEDVQVVGTLWLKHTDYTGKHSEEIRKVPVDLTLRPLQSASVPVEIPFNEYNNPAFDQSHIKALSVLEVPGTEQTYFTQKTFVLAMPKIAMSLVDDRPQTGGFTVRGTLTNPLPVPLTGGRFVIEGSRLTQPSEQAHGVVAAGATASFQYPINMAYKGPTVVSARFIAKELRNVDGHLEFELAKILQG